MRVGLFFGTFDPIHLGHVQLAKNTLNDKLVDIIWFVITPNNPLKDATYILDKEHRFNMATLALFNYDSLIPSDIEFGLKNPQYTARSLRYIQTKYPNLNFSIIMGSDNYFNISTWKNHDYILKNFQILIYKRKGYAISLKGNMVSITGDHLTISSSSIRQNIDSLDSRINLDKRVYEYIKKHSLYN